MRAFLAGTGQRAAALKAAQTRTEALRAACNPRARPDRAGWGLPGWHSLTLKMPSPARLR